MSERKKDYDELDIAQLRKSASSSFEEDHDDFEPQNAEEKAIFDWGEDEEESTPSINDLRKYKTDKDPEEDLEEIKPVEEEPKKEPPPEIGGGIILERKEPENTGVTVGPLAKGSDMAEHVAQAEKELDLLGEVAKKRMIAEGKKPKAANTVVEILMDKVGMRSVEFSEDEKAKLSMAKKIKITQIETKDLKSITFTKPKAIKQKSIIEKAFSRNYAPFVAAASGYCGKMSGLSSFEIVNLSTIDERFSKSADAMMQKASLIFSKMTECSMGNFSNFDEFAKKTAAVDIEVLLYAIVRATYPNEETILMNCANPKCTHSQKRDDGTVREVPNQFDHKYKNTEILMVDKISDKLKDEAERLYNKSFAVEDAIAAQEDAVINKTMRFGLGDNNEIIIDIYCPTIYEMIENFARKMDTGDFPDDAFSVNLLNIAAFIKSINLKNDDNNYDEFSDLNSIYEIMIRMDKEIFNVIQQCITDNIMTYVYSFGFKASDVVCPICNHSFINDVPITIESLLFLEAQRHMKED
jgi:hypothetical protein